MEDFEEEVRSGDYRRSLVALRDLIAHELASQRCGKCAMLQIRSGDTAALALRLQKVIEDIDKLPTGEEEVSTVERLRANRDTDAPNNVHLIGSKNAQRRQGGRRAGGVSGPVS